MKLPQLIALFGAFAASSISSCVVYSPLDPEFTVLEPRAEANPDPNVILGIWSDYYQMTNTGATGGALVRTMLFSRDFTGFIREKSGSSAATQQTFTWKYDGGGWWTQIRQDQSVARYRFSANSLLEYPPATTRGPTAGLDGRRVWVRGDDNAAINNDRTKIGTPLVDQFGTPIIFPLGSPFNIPGNARPATNPRGGAFANPFIIQPTAPKL